jgi:hypothetical protein
MASFNFTSSMLEESMSFVFISWVCIANGSCGFRNYIANPRKSEASAAPTSSHDTDELGKIRLRCSSVLSHKYLQNGEFVSSVCGFIPLLVKSTCKLGGLASEITNGNSSIQFATWNPRRSKVGDSACFVSKSRWTQKAGVVSYAMCNFSKSTL